MINVRKIHNKEVEDVIQLWQDSAGVVFENWENSALLKKAISEPNIITYVALDNELLVGAILAGNCGMRGLIQHLAVHEKYRRRGIGKQLVEHCLKDLESQGIGRIFFGVLNPDAIKFWKSLGFKHNEQITQMYMDVM